jgi:hypothetical protein
MTNTRDPSPNQTPISFADQDNGAWHTNDNNFRIWSCRFSADGKEVVAAGSGIILGGFLIFALTFFLGGLNSFLFGKYTIC